MKLIRSFFFYYVLFFSTLFLGFATIITFYLTRSNDKAHLLARLWGKINLWAAAVKVYVDGMENIDPNQAYVLMANHQSWFDIFAALGEIPLQFRWLAKEELFRIPVLGAAMTAGGSISIDRSDRRKAFESMNAAAERIKGGASVFVFPEGTRSPDGVLRDFKAGGFILALKSGQSIVPISFSGSHRIFPKEGSWIINPGTVRIAIEAPIPTAGLNSRDRERLILQVREAVKRHLTRKEGGYLHDAPFYAQVPIP